MPSPEAQDCHLSSVGSVVFSLHSYQDPALKHTFSIAVQSEKHPSKRFSWWGSFFTFGPLDNPQLPWGFPGSSVVQNPPAMQETCVRSLYQEDPLEKEMATHSNMLAWEISQTEDPGGLQSMGLQESDMTERLNPHDPLHFQSWASVNNKRMQSK